MNAGDDIAITTATACDLDGILALQEANQPERGGTLSAQLSRKQLDSMLADLPLLIARRGAAVVGYLLAASADSGGGTGGPRHAERLSGQARRLCLRPHRRRRAGARPRARAAALRVACEAPAGARGNPLHPRRQFRVFAGAREDGRGAARHLPPQ